MLQLCDSFMLSKGKGKYKQIEPLYYTSKGCRLSFDNERTLAGGHIGKKTPSTPSYESNHYFLILFLWGQGRSRVVGLRGGRGCTTLLRVD